MGKVPQHRLFQTDQLEQFAHPFVGRFSGGNPVHPQRLGHRGADPNPWVEAGERVLEDDLHGLPVRADLAWTEVSDVEALEQDPSLVGMVESDDEVGQRRLTTAAFADHGQCLTVVDVERDLHYGVYPGLAVGRELLGDAFHAD